MPTAAAGASAAAGGSAGLHPGESDVDKDNVHDRNDNCPTVPNRDQLDSDGDGAGDACDADDDADNIPDEYDNCDREQNTTQVDSNANGAGDACDVDTDSDGLQDYEDNCPEAANSGQENLDEDALGDACDDDVDGDAAKNGADNCPVDTNEDQYDGDKDGKGTACDPDENRFAPPSTHVTPPGGGTGPPSSGAPAAGRPGPPGLSLSLRRSYRRAELGSGIPVSAKCNEGCTLTATLVLRGTQTRAGQGKASLGDAGATFVFVRLGRTAMNRLRRQRTVKLTLVVAATDSAGETTTRQRAVVFRR